MGMLRLASAALVLLGAADALGRRSNSIEWQDCDPTEFNNTVPLKCGTLLVPLDYTSPNSSEKLQLQLIKTPAITQPSKGSILFNFGGPGEPGRAYFNSLVTEILPHTGGEFDLVAFDVRGTKNTLALNCFANEAEATRMVISWGETSNSSDVAAASLFAQAKVDANLCYQNANVNGSLVSTAFTARDLISVVDALDEDGMLRYWGYSYGTTLGATVAAMFPDRIDKMILDGVQNPHEYYNSLADFQEWTDTDATFSQIFSTCLAPGANCSLNALGLTAEELERATWDVLDYLKYNPLPLGDRIMDYSMIKTAIFSALYNPLSWPDFADSLALFLSSNATALAAYSDSMVGTTLDTPASITASLATFTAVTAIHCADRKPRVSTFDEFRPVLDELYNISSVYGDGTDMVNMHCAQWKIEPKERYEGGFEVATQNPVLFIGNTWDPYTPLLSAHNVSSGFNGSVVLEVKGYGHTSLAAPSKCTVKTAVAYWTNLTMPEDGTVCELDVIPYSSTKWSDLFEELGWSYTTGFAKNKTTARRR